MAYVAIVFLIGFLIFIHEFGHYLAARMVGIPIEVFSIGFGPKLAAWKKGGTEFRLSWIPLGGYVLPAVASEAEFFALPVWRRTLFSLGGPLANLLLPVGLFAALNALQSGASWHGLLVRPWMQTAGYTVQMLAVLPKLFAQPGQLSGVVGLVSLGGGYLAAGLANGLKFAILISLNLAVLNLLPIPGLDGGKIVMSWLEKLFPRAARWQVPATAIGLLLLLGLMAFVTVLDIRKFFI